MTRSTKPKTQTRRLSKALQVRPTGAFAFKTPAQAGTQAISYAQQFLNLPNARRAEGFLKRSMRAAKRSQNVYVETPLNIGLSELARRVFGGAIIQAFQAGNKRFDVRSLFELTTPTIQCNETINKVKYYETECWICGLKIMPYPGLKEECEHVLPIAQAAYFLALYGPDYKKFKTQYINEYTQRKATGTLNEQNPDWQAKVEKFTFYETVFNMEYDWAHSACNQIKNDMCGIYGKLINLNGESHLIATINKEAVLKLLNDIYKDSKHQLVLPLQPELVKTYTTVENFIQQRTTAFLKKYLKICQFLNQCDTFNPNSNININDECLYKFNLLCIAGAGSMKASIGVNNTLLLEKYTKDLECFQGSVEYLAFCSKIHASFIQLFIKVYNELSEIFPSNEGKTILRFEFTYGKTSFNYMYDLAETYFKILSPICYYAYITYLSTNPIEVDYNKFLQSLPYCLIGLFLNFRCNLMNIFSELVAQQKSTTDMNQKALIKEKKDKISNLTYTYIKFNKQAPSETPFPKYIEFRSNLIYTHIYYGVSEDLKSRFKLYDDLIDILTNKVWTPTAVVNDINTIIQENIPTGEYLKDDQIKPSIQLYLEPPNPAINQPIPTEEQTIENDIKITKGIEEPALGVNIQTPAANVAKQSEELLAIGPAAITVQHGEDEINKEKLNELDSDQNKIQQVVSAVTNISNNPTLQSVASTINWDNLNVLRNVAAAAQPMPQGGRRIKRKIKLRNKTRRKN